MAASFLWYDLETWGIDPRRTRIAQFAAQRTDEALQPIEDPQVVWVAPALDFLPSPDAALVTGLDPFEVERRGQCEALAFRDIAAQMSEPGTCSVGWNSLRFDDEFIRFGLYRNFYDPYAREWSNGNSRWDLLDFARLCHALRPEGIVWPTHEDGVPSFRLEHLAAANGIAHLSAHDALSDVQATLGMAQRFRAAQPKLWDYHLAFRSKQRAASLLDVAAAQPLLHVSSRFPATRACAGIVLPLCRHPAIANQIIVLELHDLPDDLPKLDAQQIADRVFVASSDLPEGVERINLKAVHLNRCPALIELRHVRDHELQRMGLDRDRCLRNAERVAQMSDLADRVAAAHALPRAWPETGDVDHALYASLPERADEGLRQTIRQSDPAALAALKPRFRDPRGDQLLWRYRARNWPQSLSEDEQRAWNEEVRARLESDTDPQALNTMQARQRLDDLRQQRADDPAALALLERVAEWHEHVLQRSGQQHSQH